MRDPRESADWLIAVTGFVPDDADPLNDIDDFWRLNNRIKELKSYVKVLSLTEDSILEGDERAIAFGRGFAHPRLWEQYADNHRGVCLCFDRDTLVQRLHERLDGFGQLHHDSVDYEDRAIAGEALTAIADKLRADGPVKAASGLIQKNLRELFFTKLEDWKTESEYRFVIETETQDEIYADVAPALRAVILGADEGSRFYEPAFAKLCDPTGVEIRHMRWLHGRPYLGSRYDQRADPPY